MNKLSIIGLYVCIYILSLWLLADVIKDSVIYIYIYIYTYL